MSIGLASECAREECGLPFIKATHNQKYCSNECCRVETNRKIMQQYHERAAIKKGKKRTCSVCETSLSRYNENKTCSACQNKRKNRASTKVGSILQNVSLA